MYEADHQITSDAEVNTCSQSSAPPYFVVLYLVNKHAYKIKDKQNGVLLLLLACHFMIGVSHLDRVVCFLGLNIIGKTKTLCCVTVI